MMHARAGGSIEVMGLLQGKISGNSLIVMNVIALPGEGTETRVNALQDANQDMVGQLEYFLPTVARPEAAIGWYHSHPGFGCWLSGVDVGTQMTNQMLEPSVAVVVRNSLYWKCCVVYVVYVVYDHVNVQCDQIIVYCVMVNVRVMVNDVLWVNIQYFMVILISFL